MQTTPILNRGLGWFSVALGATELAFPKRLARGMGLDTRSRAPMIVRALGARELMSGLGILLRPRASLPLWSRLAGDVVDLALLGFAIRKSSKRAGLAGAFAAVAGVTVLDVIASRRAQKQFIEDKRPLITSVTINKPTWEVYTFYRDFEALPRFMEHVEEVQEIDDTHSHWIARMPGGGTLEWDAELVEDQPGVAIGWRAIDGAPIATSGRITFSRAPEPTATEVRVEMQLGALAKLVAKPQIEADLRRLKQVMETGEVLR